ncbi:helix-turn-helix domain-containing protein [Paenibacillus aurantius]|uniref:Helix-turn-helix domain-containing protein n=1 Tax=Paenibacillus aurantius TaxID=2918900 RepID=A0AA96REG8_9BACL|nr:helix-turn-helix domain-containing protein [Paenibacillus aurantius]WNQ10153.1 helix-turn-helix domain-containing protein [Paenibacillus aurantius]
MEKKIRTHRTGLFWTFFTKYFALILIPVIAASLLTNIFIVKLIESDAENINNIVMQGYSEQTDSLFSSLESDMVNMLSTSNIKSILNDGTSDSTQRLEGIHSLMGQLAKLQSHRFVYNAFLYFAKADLIIDGRTYKSKREYFQENYPLDDQDRAAYLANFTDKKSMQFTGPHTVMEKPPFTEDAIQEHSNLSVLLSYPFNSSDPDVYLAVNVSRDKTSEQLGIPRKWVTDTALLDSGGNVLIHNGSTELKPGLFLPMLVSSREQELLVKQQTKGFSYRKSRFNDSWSYVSIIDMQTLLKPARMVQTFTIVFLGLFVVAGTLISYYLSRRLYHPIQEIRTGLEAHRIDGLPIQDGGNEFDVIKRCSHTIVSRNKELSQRVGGMYPIVEEHFISKILLGEYRDSLSIDYYAKEIDFRYRPITSATVLVIEFQFYSHPAEPLSETTKSFMLTELKEKIHKLSSGAIWVCLTHAERLACVLLHGSETPPDARETAETIKQLLQQPHYKAAIGLGTTVQGIEQLHSSYRQAAAMLKHKSLVPGVEICGISGKRPAGDGFLSVDEVNRIFNRYKAKDYDGLLQAACELLEAGMRNNTNAHQMKNMGVDMLNTWIRAVESERGEFNISFYSELLASLTRCVTWEELRHCFHDIHAMLFRAIQPSDRKQQFAEILAYIQEHYHEELSMELFAERMNMSVGHFSRLFKEEVGEKYVEYIAKLRIHRSKTYLLQTDMKIDDIAGQVGYWGRNSFIRNFRRYEGITPAKFREIHQA